MQSYEINLWGMAPLLLLFAASLALLWLTDRRLMASALSSAAHVFRPLRRVRTEWRVAAAAAGGLAAAVAVAAAALMACLPARMLPMAAALMALAVAETMGAALTAYMRSFNNTQAHRYYLLANGATHLESLAPSLRRALRACTMPQARHHGAPLATKAALLFTGLLMGGTTAATAALTTLLICAAALVATITATLTTAFLLKKLNICR